MLFLCEQCSTIEVFWWKDLIPLLSPIVVLSLFIVDRIINYHLRKNEVRRNWYMKILVEPCIDKISNFYKDTLKFYSDSIVVLEENKSQPHNLYTTLKAKQFGNFQVLKREFEAEVIFPIQIRYPIVGSTLTDSLLELEDIFTNSLDQELFTEEGVQAFHQALATNRAHFLKELYSPLKDNN